MKQRKIKRYGWKPSLPDIRDKKLSLRKLPKPMPSEVDLRPDMPEIYDQKSLGSCTGNMAAAMYEYSLKQAGLKTFTPSRLFIYYNERVIEGTANFDSGAEIKDALKVMNQYGVCSEETLPYDISKFAENPSRIAFAEAKKNVIHNYATIDNTNLDAMKLCLAHKFPIGIGFTVYESFESREVAKTGVVPMPNPTERVLGGHAILIVGFLSKTKQFIVRNSWGTSWGDKGYFYMPFNYFLNPNLASDAWMMRLTPSK